MSSVSTPPKASVLARAMHRFINTESTGGLLLVGMMVVALAVVNSPWGGTYQHILHLPVAISFGAARLDMSLLHWINDGLMAVFFLVVALEIKRECMVGELSSLGQVMLPTVAAIGGMAVPALVYLAFNGTDAHASRGWAIPSATDIAFSLGVLAVLGRRVPASLRVFLTALAIIDDLGAIVIIALFYTADLSFAALGVGAVLVVVLAVLNRMRVPSLAPYLIVGAALWLCMLQSGIHATIAGVVTGLFVPLQARRHSPLRRLEHGLHPWVSYAILPLFALANSGLSFAGIGAAVVVEPIFLGVALGLFLGKQVGVFGMSWLLIRFKAARLPDGAGWMQFYGVAILTGIGFTMSLFIGALAFPSGEGVETVRLGVLAGSLISAVAGWTLLRFSQVRSAP